MNKFIYFFIQQLVATALIRTTRDSIGQNRFGNHVYNHEVVNTSMKNPLENQIYGYLIAKNMISSAQIRHLLNQKNIPILAKIMLNGRINDDIKKQLGNAQGKIGNKRRFQTYRRNMKNRNSS